MPTKFSFTGQSSDGFGLMDFHARFYSSQLGRFVSPDSLLPNLIDPAFYDRYSYVRNNPIRRVDINGHLDCDAPYVAPGDCSDVSSYSLLLTVNVNVILDANGNVVSSQFDIDSKLYESDTNGLCGTISAAAVLGGVNHPNITANKIVELIGKGKGITNWLGPGQIADVLVYFGWEACNTNDDGTQMSLGGSSEDRRNILNQYISQGYYSFVWVWVYPSGAWVENNGQFLQPGESALQLNGINVYGHWIVILGISDDNKLIKIYDPIRGVVEMPWDDFYNNVSIRWSDGDAIYDHITMLIAKPMEWKYHYQME